MTSVRVIGAGLAGCEAALQLASSGMSVALFEMKPLKWDSIPAWMRSNRGRCSEERFSGGIGFKRIWVSPQFVKSAVV